MRQSADRNEIDAGCCDHPHSLESDAAARLEFNVPAFAQRHCLAQLRRTHVIEEDQIDFGNLKDCAHLPQVVSFHFDLQIRSLRLRSPNRFSETNEIRLTHQM